VIYNNKLTVFEVIIKMVMVCGTIEISRYAAAFVFSLHYSGAGFGSQFYDRCDIFQERASFLHDKLLLVLVPVLTII
jgi:hypothetical protein